MKINNIQVNNKQQVDNFYFPSNLEGAWLENVIKEIWEDKEYEKFDTKINPGDIVLDLGANVECNDKNLVDFSKMGSALFKSLFK